METLSGLASEMTVAADSFELRGEFAGFFRDVCGKRGMVLRVAGEEVYLKIPKALRHELDEVLHPGQAVVVSGSDSAEERDGRDRRVVLQVRTDDAAAACVACPIRVCAKKNCWRNGGRELWRELEHQIESAGLADTVKLKAVNCLDHCKHGPNAEVAGHDFHRCTPEDAERILERLTNHAM